MSQNTQIEALKPCPFCGTSGEALETFMEGIWWRVACDQCGGMGTRRLTKPDAEYEWNRRAIRETSEEPVAWSAKELRKAAFSLPCDDQFNLATAIAGNLGYDLTPDNGEIDPVPLASPAVAPVAVSVKGLPLWQVGSWGDGSTPAGQANIFCEAYEATIAAGIDWVKADDIVTCHNGALSSIIPATKGGEEAIRRAWEYGRNSWCPAGILTDKERTEREWGNALAALAQDTTATPPSDTEEKAP